MRVRKGGEGWLLTSGEGGMREEEVGLSLLYTFLLRSSLHLLSVHCNLTATETVAVLLSG
jgi:hypothetical protein